MLVPVAGANVNRLTVASTGPDANLGFKPDDWVEILHATDELEGIPGTLAQVATVDDSAGSITLKQLGTNPMPVTITLADNPRLRRWDGLGTVTANLAVNNGFLALEQGVEVRFSQPVGAEFRTGDYWLIPARAASPDAEAGKLEWPRTAGTPDAVPPRGIRHHFCRLGVITVTAAGSVTPVSDCRCLWPALTSVPRLFYVSGDGQEVMPDLTQPAQFFKLPQPLIVGVANAQCLQTPLTVRFTVTGGGGGRVAAKGMVPTVPTVAVPTDAAGLASCDFYLAAAPPSQQVTARLLDAGGNEVSLPVIFNANLSIASQVAFDPGLCAGLAGQKTVQDAVARLASLASIYKVDGDGQQAAAGAGVKTPLRVRVANRCGPAAGMPVSFQVVLGGGVVSPDKGMTDAAGEVTCNWQLGADSLMQVVEAQLAGDATRPTTEPRKVHFVAHLTGEGSNDPAPVRIVGVRVGKEARVLVNGQTLAPDDLGSGVLLLCDQAIDPDTVTDPTKTETSGTFVRGQPTCFVTVEVPYPLTQAERNMWDLTAMAGYHSIILHGQVTAVPIADTAPPPGPPLPTGLRARGLITWQTSGPTIAFLNGVIRFLRAAPQTARPDRVLLRLTLKGNFIWSVAAKKRFEQGTPGGYLDGDSFRAPLDKINESAVLLPSGDSRRGGDFEMWFWLAVTPG